MVPKIDVVVLGLLAEGPAHGYGLVERFRARSMDRWVGAGRASIYQALVRLEAAGSIAGRAEDGPEGPDRRVFRITRAGRSRLRTGVRGHLGSQGPYAAEAGAALGFLGALPPDDLRGALAERAQVLTQLVASLDGAPGRSPDGEPVTALTRALLDRQQTLAEAELSWFRAHRRLLLRGLEEGSGRADG